MTDDEIDLMVDKLKQRIRDLLWLATARPRRACEPNVDQMCQRLSLSNVNLPCVTHNVIETGVIYTPPGSVVHNPALGPKYKWPVAQ